MIMKILIYDTAEHFLNDIWTVVVYFTMLGLCIPGHCHTGSSTYAILVEGNVASQTDS